MESNDRERYIDKIRKLFALAGNNPSEEEAASAALQAQRLMAKYSIDPSEVEGGAEAAKQKIIEVETETMRDTRTWRFHLARVVAEAFRCEVFQSCVYEGGRKLPRLVFYGYEGDAQAAALTFNYLYKAGTRLARAQDREHRKRYGFASGVFNSFVIGFTRGVEAELKAQSQELMIVESEEVKNAYREYSKSMGKVSAHRMRRGSSSAAAAGERAGRDAVTSRRMTSGVSLLC